MPTKKPTVKKIVQPNVNKQSCNRTGRPPIYKSPDELQAKIDEYFEKGFRKRKVMVKLKDYYEWVEWPVYTITGLVLYCGYCDRASFYDLEKKKEFTHTLKQARTRIEQEYEELLQIQGGSGAIFGLKNFGWRDRQELEVHEHQYKHKEFEDMSADELKAEANRIRNELSGHLGTSKEN